MPSAKVNRPDVRLLLAIDPGFATMGAAVLDEVGALVEADTFESEPLERPARPGPTFAADERRRRAAAAWKWLCRVVEHARQEGEIVAVVAEANNGSRGFGVALALGVGSTLVGALGVELRRRWPTMLDPVLVAPEQWREPLVRDYWKPVPPPRARKGEAAERTAARMKIRRKNRAEEDRHLYAAIGNSYADPRSDENEITTREWLERRLQSWSRKPRSIVHAFDAVGAGRFVLEHHPATRAMMRPATAASCPTCSGTGKELIDCDGSAGYRPCPTCKAAA